MSIQESLRLVSHGPIAVLEWDLIGEKVNKLSSPIMARFREILAELKTSPYKAIIFVSKKQKIFIAGADIEEIKGLSNAMECRQVLSEAHEIFNALEDLPIPTIAAIHGACLGGGCELVMACDYRLASDAKETKIGLPEIKLGVFPGFGGCLRLPRIVGLQASLDIILQGKSVDSKKALKMGWVDECVPEQLLEKRAFALAQEIVSGKKGKQFKKYVPKTKLDSFLESFVGRRIVFSKAKKSVLSATKGFYPAPLKALEVIQKTYGCTSREKSQAIEMAGFGEVAIGPISKYLIDIFYLTESVKKQTGVPSLPDLKPKTIRRMAVLGAGTMGGGIAQLAADNQIEVRMKDITNEALALGYKAASDLWQKDLQRKKLTAFDFQRKMSLISGGLDFSGFGQMDLVVEAIVEDMEVKKKVIAETVKHCSDQCIIATNTSSLSVTEMAKAHPYPKNFVGMHFFNPVNKMPLVEVIRGPQSSDEATAAVFACAKRMGKIPVVVKDGPGFLVNRLLMPYMIEAMFILEDGMDVQTVDHWFTHKFGMPMGPYRLMDEVGLDVCLKVVKIFKKSLGDRIEIPKITEKLASSGRLGKKNGRGYYSYDEKGKEMGVDHSIYKDLGLSQPTQKLTEKEVLERGVFTMINEAALVLYEDRIVEKPDAVDLGMIMGTGFPPFRGGLLRYADSLGTKYIATELDVYAARFGKRLTTSQPLANMAKNDRKFYS
ncbi:MAG: enoyl-CoA hydratase/isomerase family protein [Bdellovibrionales bacterium]|nr:enoyl-CoA hydratase/isomerase family protein [Bdellovibrionales bacterium]